MNGTWQGGRATAVTYSILKENLNNNIPKGWNHTHTQKKRRRDSDQGATAAIVSFSIYWSFSFGFFEACFLFSFLYISGTYSLFVLRNLVLCTLRYSSFFLLFVDLWFCHTSFFLCIQLVFFFFCVTALFFHIFFFAEFPYGPLKTLRHKEARSLLFFSLSLYIFPLARRRCKPIDSTVFFSYQNIRLLWITFCWRKELWDSLRVCVCVCRIPSLWIVQKKRKASSFFFFSVLSRRNRYSFYYLRSSFCLVFEHFCCFF